MYVCIFVGSCAPCVCMCPDKPEGIRSPRNGVKGNWELLGKCAENLTQILCKSSKHS